MFTVDSGQVFVGWVVVSFVNIEQVYIHKMRIYLTPCVQAFFRVCYNGRRTTTYVEVVLVSLLLTLTWNSEVYLEFRGVSSRHLPAQS